MEEHKSPKYPQLNLFNDKFLVDKNFSFDVFFTEEGPEYKYSFEESFDEPEHEILDLLTFLLIKTYENPIKVPEFTLEEYAEYKGRDIRKLRRLTSGKRTENYTNDVERRLYRMLSRKLIFKKSFITSDGTELKDRYKSLEICDQFERTTSLVDKRKKVYVARLNKRIRMNLARFVFLLSRNDYQLIINDHFRNSNYRKLYFKLGNIFNNLKAGIKDETTFDELCFILGYSTSREKSSDSKVQITDSVNKLLKLESLKGLAFDWKPTKHGQDYIPHFFLNKESLPDNLYGEKTIDVFKRLDIALLTEISEYITFSRELPYIEKKNFASLMNQYQVLDRIKEIYKGMFRKEMSKEQVTEFANNYIYIDDFGNRYGSNLIRHIQIDGKPIQMLSMYDNVRFLYK